MGAKKYMGAHTVTLRLVSVAALVGAALIAVLGLSSGTLSGGAVVFGMALALLGVSLLVAQRRRVAAQTSAGTSHYIGRHRQI